MTGKHTQRTSAQLDDLSRRKLEAFARIEDDFLESFLFVEEVHGQRRFTTFPVASTVRYLHALSICEVKDRLLSVAPLATRYEGERALNLLCAWQQGATADVVEFIHHRLDNQPFGQVSRQIEDALRAGDARRAQRLLSGRMVLLNRNFTLSQALDAIFRLTPDAVAAEARASCERLGDTPEAIEQRLAALRSDLAAYAPSPELARRNMLVMNRLGPQVMSAAGDRPGERTDAVQPPASPEPPYAEETIPGETTLVSMNWNAPFGRDQIRNPEAVQPLPPLGAVAPDSAESLGRDPLAQPTQVTELS